MSIPDSIRFENPAFFSENQIDAWIESRHEQFIKLRVALLRISFPVLASGIFFSSLLAFAVGNTPVEFVAWLLLGTVAFFFIWFIIVREKLMYMAREWPKQRDGTWFAVLKCNCDTTIKALDPIEVKKCKNNMKGYLPSCYGCNTKNKKKEGSKSGIMVKETCVACTDTKQNVDRCKICKSPVKVVKMWKKRVDDGEVRSSIYKLVAKHDRMNGYRVVA